MADTHGDGGEEDDTVTLDEVLKDEEDFEEHANAILAGSDSTSCSFNKGYVGRQALYACATCAVPADGGTAKSAAGICLGCSYACHDGHDLTELYTKRNFRCDCGNSKFPSQPCKFLPDKPKENDGNSYNQNFSGLFCTCHRPYPDPDSDVPDEMLQCAICEDWFHGRHLGVDAPDNDAYEEMVCGTCMGEHSFLSAYTANSVVTKISKEEDEKKEVNVCESTEEQKEEKKENDEEEAAVNVVDGKGEAGGVMSGQCLLKDLQVGKLSTGGAGGIGATFWMLGWREKLCRCDDCLLLYVREKVEYLTSEKDSIRFYEESAKESHVSMHDAGMAAFSTMDRTQQIEMLHGFNDLKDKLNSFLKEFHKSGKVVGPEHINNFFEDMQHRRKKQKTHDGMPPPSCG